MDKRKVLVITNEMDPYVKLTPQANFARQLPQKLQDDDIEIRVFMPRFGKINERKHRLHEVIRLSGINIQVGEDDNPMIIKVASLPAAKLQVYFIDNEDFFHRKAYLTNKEGKYFEDNDERTIFFNKGAVEILLKLGWLPDIIHCHGWMTGLIPMIAKTLYKGEPAFKNSRIIFTPYSSDLKMNLGENFIKKCHLEGKAGEAEKYLNNPGPEELTMIGTMFADAVTLGTPDLSKDILDAAKKGDRPFLDYIDPESDEFAEKYHDFYNNLLPKED